jgi:hypothetical protein
MAGGINSDSTNFGTLTGSRLPPGITPTASTSSGVSSPRRRSANAVVVTPPIPIAASAMNVRRLIPRGSSSPGSVLSCIDVSSPDPSPLSVFVVCGLNTIAMALFAKSHLPEPGLARRSHVAIRNAAPHFPPTVRGDVAPAGPVWSCREATGLRRRRIAWSRREPLPERAERSRTAQLLTCDSLRRTGPFPLECPSDGPPTEQWCEKPAIAKKDIGVRLVGVVPSHHKSSQCQHPAR